LAFTPFGSFEEIPMSKLLLSLAAISVCAGCATSPMPPPAAGAANPTAQANVANSVTAGPALTGSRLAKRNTDRAMRSIDNQTFKDETPISGRGNDLGMRGN
jgi:hypothetical protein